MRIAVVDESAARASVIREGLATLPDCEIFVVTERRGLVARIGEIAPDIVLMDLGNPSRDMLEDYFAVSRALARPIAMFVDESDAAPTRAAVEAGVSAYIVNGLHKDRVKNIVDMCVTRFHAFARLAEELAQAKTALADRKIIDRAKALLMKSRAVDEEAAYAMLRRSAMNQNVRIAEIARAVVTAAEIE